jgi:antitoxin ParD1/3/4
MDVFLPSDLEQFVADQIQQGSFESPAAVICEGLGLLRERERQLADLRAKLQEGAEQLKRGEGIPADEVFAELRARNEMLQQSADRKRA